MFFLYLFIYLFVFFLILLDLFHFILEQYSVRDKTGMSWMPPRVHEK